MVDFRINTSGTQVNRALPPVNGEASAFIPPTGDLVIFHGKLLEVTGVDEIMQRVRTRLNKQLGEWRYNLDSGVPWMDYNGTPAILGSRNSVDRASVVIQDVARQTDGVTSVRIVQIRFDTVTRAFVLQMDVETIYGAGTISI